jgi:hypothetical protein
MGLGKIEDLKYENVALAKRRYTFYQSSSLVEQEDKVIR